MIATACITTAMQIDLTICCSGDANVHSQSPIIHDSMEPCESGVSIGSAIFAGLIDVTST